MQNVLSPDKMYNIIPNSGIQFLDFGFSTEDLEGFRRTFSETIVDDCISLQPIKANSEGDLETADGTKVDMEETFAVKFQDAVKAFSNCWLPMPFLKHLGGGAHSDRFEEGPTNWVRFRITPLETLDENGFDYRLTLAIDTSTSDRSQLQSYVMPLYDDIENEAVFGFAYNILGNAWVLDQSWMKQWLDQQIARVDSDIRLPKKDRNVRETASWAVFLTLLEGLHQAGIDPQLKLVDTVSEGARSRAIDVDLVLDIGNSRTCGVLIEKRSAESGGLDLKNAQTLRLREFTDPTISYREPFQSDVEFRKAMFGDERLSRFSGRRRSFEWPSLVRVGPEAVRLNAGRFGSEGASGLSAPKRYLWDEAPAVRPWFFNTSYHDTEVSPIAVVGGLRKFLTSSGDALSEIGNGASSAMEPLFSRSSMFSLMLVEVVMQAHMQINSVAHRKLFQPESSPRRLARVIITIPTGTPLVERQLFEKRAQHARALLLEVLGESPAIKRHDEDPPLQFSVRLDEATCTQFTYLYGLIADHFKKHAANRVFQIIGKPDRSGFRIGSLDIGGGTTDLVITDFDTADNNQRIRPQPIFREGFRRAGDDLLRAVISKEVLQAMAANVEAAGVPNGDKFIAEWMRRSGGDDLSRQNRKLFTGQVLRKLGLAVLGAHENQGFLDDYVARSKEVFSIDVAHVLKDIDEELLNSFEAAVLQAGGQDFKLVEMELSSSGKRIEAVIASEMDGMLHDLCRVVNELDCDVLLVSGRPSRLPAMREVIRRHIPVSPHRVVAMHGHQVGPWNPFARGRGFIEDPKTTVVVGALIASLGGEGGLEEFDIDLSGIEESSTARIIGQMEGRFLRDGAILFDDSKNPDATESQAISWTNTTFLGFRQIASERWPATPLYRLATKADVSQKMLATRPWKVVLARHESPEPDEYGRRKARPEKLWVHSLEQASHHQNSIGRDNLELRLQTMADDDYWLDTGFIDYQGTN
ncbi:MAG: virulence factor SrfB [Roseibium sp.]